MKKGFDFRSGIILVVQILAFIIIPMFITEWIPDCTVAESLTISACVSLMISLWNSDLKFNEKFNEWERYEEYSRKEFDNMRQQFSTLQTFLRFQKYINQTTHPYFKKHVNAALEENLECFVKKNRDLIEGYVETNPYQQETFGIEGMKWTRVSIYAVSSIGDYWERENFVSDYLQVQFDLINSKHVTIKRIFIASSAKRTEIESTMKLQRNNGIEVFFLNSDSQYFNKAWVKEDFLIQDEILLVDMQCESHKFDENGKEIITINEALVHKKKTLFFKMLESAECI